MVSALTVGSTTAVCALSDQVKKYRARVVGNHQHHHAGESDAKSNNSHHPIPTLLLLCLKVISDRFRFEPKVQNVPRKFLPEVMARLPLDLDVCISAPHVSDENYWKRCCLSKLAWENLQIADHGLTRKQLFLEKHLQDLLEDFDANVDDPDHLVDVVKACSEFVFSLEIRLREADGDTLALGLQHDASVVALDLRLNSDIPVEAERLVQIAQKLRRNEVELKSGSGHQQLA